MTTAVDTSVILALVKREPGWESWSRVLREALSEGGLLACPVVFAEVGAGFDGLDECVVALRSLGIEYAPFEPRATWIAGRVFAGYRRGGGPRDHLIPDFLIAAHALTQADRLAAADRGYLRRYFPDLAILTP